MNEASAAAHCDQKPAGYPVRGSFPKRTCEVLLDLLQAA